MIFLDSKFHYYTAQIFLKLYALEISIIDDKNNTVQRTNNYNFLMIASIFLLMRSKNPHDPFYFSCTLLISHVSKLGYGEFERIFKRRHFKSRGMSLGPHHFHPPRLLVWVIFFLIKGIES